MLRVVIWTSLKDVVKLGGGGWVGGWGGDGECNRVHLHIMFALLYSVCRCVSVLSCGLRHSIFYVCVTYVMRQRDKKREEFQRPLAYMYHPKEKKK